MFEALFEQNNFLLQQLIATTIATAIIGLVGTFFVSIKSRVGQVFSNFWYHYYGIVLKISKFEVNQWIEPVKNEKYNAIIWWIQEYIQKHKKGTFKCIQQTNTIDLTEMSKRDLIYGIKSDTYQYDIKIIDATLAPNDSTRIKIQNFEVWFDNMEPSDAKELDNSCVYIRYVGSNSKIDIQWMYNWLLRIVRDHKVYQNKRDYPQKFLFDESQNQWIKQCDIFTQKTWDSLILEQETKNFIKNDINTFLQQKEYYKQLGIPYKKSYLLYGKPGTGKTSLIYTLAWTLKKDLYYVNLKNIKDDLALNKIVSNIPSKSIIVFEDIDCQSEITRPRDLEDNNKKVQINTKENKNMFTFDNLTLSSLLGCLDGYILGNESIIIMTTNCIEKLDPALIRPGRMDVQLQFEYCTHYQLDQLYKFINNMDPNENEKILNFKGIKEKTISPCKASGIFMKHLGQPKEVIEDELKKSV